MPQFDSSIILAAANSATDNVNTYANNVLPSL